MGKDPTRGKRPLCSEGLKAKGDKGSKKTTEDEMVRWHHRLGGCESEETVGDSEGQGILVCCSLKGHKESDTT